MYEEKSTEIKGHFYRPDIDGLRAIAVSVVIAFHAFPKIFPGGYIGVDLFFVISGFLISSIILNQIETKTFSLVRFYARRIRRIAPSLIITLILTAAVSWYILVSSEFENLGKEISAGSLFYSNFYYYNLSGYFDSEDNIKYLLHLWSLAVEEHFYIFWPILLLVTSQSKFAQLVIATILLIMSCTACVWLTLHNQNLAFYLSLTRFWEPIAGAILAIAFTRNEIVSGNLFKFKSLISTMGVVMILALCFLLKSGEGFPGWKAILPVAAAAMVIGAGSQAWPNRKILALQPIVYVGLISYPIYLLHWPLLMFAQTIAVKSPATLTKLVVIIITIILAAMIFHAVEKPLRRSPALQINAIALLALMFSASFLGYLLIYNQGFPNRSAAKFGPEVAAFLRSQSKSEIDKSNCNLPSTVTFECHSDVHLDRAKVAVIGDSHAGALYPGLNNELAGVGEPLVWLGGNACPFLLDLERDQKCGDSARQILKIIADHPSMTTVLIVNRWALYDSNEFFGDAERKMQRFPVILSTQPELKDPHAILTLSLARTIEALGAMNKRVILVSDVPELGVHPTKCFRRAFRENAADCNVSLTDFEKRTLSPRHMLANMAARYSYVRFYDPSPVLCDSEKCIGKANGEFLYQDDDHLSLLGSSIVAKNLIAAISWLKENP
jgi:peptidoglycan/LPS O-acetylase OafA/YrhL